MRPSLTHARTHARPTPVTLSPDAAVTTVRIYFALYDHPEALTSGSPRLLDLPATTSNVVTPLNHLPSVAKVKRSWLSCVSHYKYFIVCDDLKVLTSGSSMTTNNVMSR